MHFCKPRDNRWPMHLFSTNYLVVVMPAILKQTYEDEGIIACVPLWKSSLAFFVLSFFGKVELCIAKRKKIVLISEKIPIIHLICTRKPKQQIMFPQWFLLTASNLVLNSWLFHGWWHSCEFFLELRNSSYFRISSRLSIAFLNNPWNPRYTFVLLRGTLCNDWDVHWSWDQAHAGNRYWSMHYTSIHT